MADVNSTQYAKLVGTVQDLMKPVEGRGKVRATQFTLTNPASGMPTSSEFAYLTKLPVGANIIGFLGLVEAGFQASGTATLELETGASGGNPTYTAITGALDMATGGTLSDGGTGIGVAAFGQGRVRLNPGVNTVASKYFKGTILYCVD